MRAQAHTPAHTPARTKGRTLLVPRWVYLGKGEVAADRAVLVEGNRIAAIVAADEALDASRVELPGQLLLPGLMNMHTHAGAGPVGRAISEDYLLPAGMPFYVPLSRLWRFAYQERFREAFRAVIRWDVLGMIRTGTTMIFNHASTDFEGYLAIAAELGVRSYAGPTIPLNVTHRLGQLEAGAAHRPDLADAGSQRAELDAITAMFESHNGSCGDRIRVVLGPAAVHTDDFSVLTGVAAAARRLGDCLVTTHLCQAPAELAETDRKYGKTPLRVLADAGLANDRLIAAHGTYLPDADRELAAECAMTIVHCASRKAKEAITSPLVSFAESGIRMAMGTDGFSGDMVEELKLAATLGKIATGSTHRPTAVQILDLATADAARSLGRDDLGVIREGALADLVGVRIGPAFDPVQSLVYYSGGHYSGGHPVDFQMIDGATTVRDGLLVGVDVDSARQAAEGVLEEIWQQAIAEGLLTEVLPTTSRAEREPDA
jgi:cytosine/adenosine deaminase-related metal-dependent hydrolase